MFLTFCSQYFNRVLIYLILLKINEVAALIMAVFAVVKAAGRYVVMDHTARAVRANNK